MASARLCHRRPRPLATGCSLPSPADRPWPQRGYATDGLLVGSLRRLPRRALCPWAGMVLMALLRVLSWELTAEAAPARFGQPGGRSRCWEGERVAGSGGFLLMRWLLVDRPAPCPRLGAEGVTPRPAAGASPDTGPLPGSEVLDEVIESCRAASIRRGSSYAARDRPGRRAETARPRSLLRACQDGSRDRVLGLDRLLGPPGRPPDTTRSRSSQTVELVVADATAPSRAPMRVRLDADCPFCEWVGACRRELRGRDRLSVPLRCDGVGVRLGVTAGLPLGISARPPPALDEVGAPIAGPTAPTAGPTAPTAVADRRQRRRQRHRRRQRAAARTSP